MAEEVYLNHYPSLPLRSGTTLRPGVRLAVPATPLYLRAALPIHVETPEPYDAARSTYNLRVGAGVNVPAVLFKVYVEADPDESLGGGREDPGAFSAWHVWLNSGLDFRF